MVENQLKTVLGPNLFCQKKKAIATILILKLCRRWLCDKTSTVYIPASSFISMFSICYPLVVSGIKKGKGIRWVFPVLMRNSWYGHRTLTQVRQPTHQLPWNQVRSWYKLYCLGLTWSSPCKWNRRRYLC